MDKQECLAGRSSNDYQVPSDLQSLNLGSISSHAHEHIAGAFLVNKNMKRSFIMDIGIVA